MKRIFRYDDVPPVKTTAGLLQGYFVDNVYIFKGVPYAQARRFQKPEPVTPWEGIKDVTSYGFVCPLMTQDTPTGELLVPHRYWPQDENCQNLNIWTRTLDSDVKKPVVVWIHGGGYFAGSSIEQEAYDGENMASNGDVVVVSVNHRLNILGYLDVSPFGEKYKNSANAGQADLVAAMQWIHDNISEFGGDPENITLFGQSGGGMKIGALLQTPASDGLFHKVLMMSGVADDESPIMPRPSGDGRAVVTAMMKELDIPLDMAEQLETIPYQDLVRAYSKVSPAIAMQGGYVGCYPLVNEFFLGDPLTCYTEHAKEIPMMVSTVFGEFAFAPFPYNKKEITEQETQDILNRHFGEKSPKLVELFTQAYPGKHPLDLLCLDRVFRIPSCKLAMKHTSFGKAPAYMYAFAPDFSYQNGKPAWHCSDIPFIFNNVEKVPSANIANVSEKLEREMFHAFMNFAYTGNPSSPDLEWPACKPGDAATMVFEEHSSVRHNFDDALLELFEEIAPPFSLAALFQQDIQH